MRVALVEVEGARRAAHQVVRVRVLAAEHRVDLDHLLLPLERLEVVRHRHEVRLRRQLVGGVAPVAVREDPELAALDKRRQPLLEVGEVPRRALRPVRDALGQLGGLLRVGLQRADDVHPVERVQVVEVDHVVLHVLGAEHQVADELRIGRHGDAQRIFDRPYRREGVHGRADAAHPLGKRPRVARVASLQDDLDAAHHRPGAVGIDDLAVLHFDFDAQVPLDPGDGVDDNTIRHDALLCPRLRVPTSSPGSARSRGFPPG